MDHTWQGVENEFAKLRAEIKKGIKAEKGDDGEKGEKGDRGEPGKAFDQKQFDSLENRVQEIEKAL